MTSAAVSTTASEAGFEALARLLRVLAHEDRLKLLALLSDEERDVQTLASETSLASARVSQHLALLRAHRIVRDRRSGRRVFYRLCRPGLADWIQNALPAGDAR